MKITYFSDLHLEFADWTPPHIDADVVILAGDINLGAKGVAWAKKHFTQPVIYIPGNHEYYTKVNINMDDINQQIRKEAKNSNVIILLNDSVNINGINFIGTTLWTDYNLNNNQRDDMFSAKLMLNDHSMIKVSDENSKNIKLTPSHCLELHNRSIQFISNSIREDLLNIVISHHGVHEKCSHPHLHGNDLSAAFNSDLISFIESHSTNLTTWIYGHTHHNFDFQIAGVDILTNQRGYAPYELVDGFKDNKTFNV